MLVIETFAKRDKVKNKVLCFDLQRDERLFREDFLHLGCQTRGLRVQLLSSLIYETGLCASQADVFLLFRRLISGGNKGG